MKFEPGTRVIDDPSLADRVTNVRMAPQTYETAEDLATQNRMQSQFGSANKAASPAQPDSRSRVNARASQESDGKQDTKKRQWTVDRDDQIDRSP